MNTNAIPDYGLFWVAFDSKARNLLIVKGEPDHICGWGALFSKCERFRYALWRIWDPQVPPLGVIGLNPSTADEFTNDPTVARCYNRAKRGEFGGLIMLNLFAFRSTDPHRMKREKRPVGPFNDRAILHYTPRCGIVVAAWGCHGDHLDRANQFLAIVKTPLHCLGQTKSGAPRHPLYLRNDAQIVPFFTPATAQAKWISAITTGARPV